jgi:hypothetical protein
MKKLIFLNVFIILFILINTYTASFALAACGGAGGDAQGSVEICNPIPGNPDIQTMLGKIIYAVLGLVGSLALVMFIYGGFTWMLSSGNNEKVQKGKDILIWATLGLVIIFSAYAILKLVFSGLGVPTT